MNKSGAVSVLSFGPGVKGGGDFVGAPPEPRVDHQSAISSRVGFAAVVYDLFVCIFFCLFACPFVR